MADASSADVALMRFGFDSVALNRIAARAPIQPLSRLPHRLLARFSREKLYEEVWAQPVREVASEYGVSDVALAKTCRKLEIPLPGRAYWASLAAGIVRERPALPAFPGSEPK